ncbi:hypothetical protein GIB67_021283, partial [Kingdonia uniflora]
MSDIVLERDEEALEDRRKHIQYFITMIDHICTQKQTILSVEDIVALIGDKCDGVIRQLTEDWGEVLFSALSKAGGKAFSNMVVGYNNVDVNAAT